MYEIKVERYIFEPLMSNMYLIMEENRALVIDPCISEEAFRVLKKNKINNVDIIVTHEHYDHISGIPMLKNNFCTHIVASKSANNRISDPKNHIASRYAATFIGRSSEVLALVKKQCKTQIVVSADTVFENNYNFMWGNHSLHLVSTPGHSPGSICIFMDDSYLFTGDSLIPGELVITRFPGGDMAMYKKITEPYFRSLDPQLMVFPGHGEHMKLGEILL